jgi:hypothetical protein
MPRVVPSQVAVAIKRMFPSIVDNPASQPGYAASDLPSLMMLVKLVEAVPEELLSLVPDSQLELFASLAALHGVIEMVQNPKVPSGSQAPFRGLQQHPIALIYKAMTQCPDAVSHSGPYGLR